MNATQAKSALIALLLIGTMGLMVIDQRAPFFMLMGFVLMGVITSMVYGMHVYRTRTNITTVYPWYYDKATYTIYHTTRGIFIYEDTPFSCDILDEDGEVVYHDTHPVCEGDDLVHMMTVRHNRHMGTFVLVGVYHGA